MVHHEKVIFTFHAPLKTTFHFHNLSQTFFDNSIIENYLPFLQVHARKTYYENQNIQQTTMNFAQEYIFYDKTYITHLTDTHTNTENFMQATK